MKTYRPRNDMVVIREVLVDKSPGGVVMPQKSAEGKKIVVEAVGPKVEGLRPGDRVILVGSRENGDWSFLPGEPALAITRQENLVAVVALVFVALRQFGVAPPAWVMQVAWILLVAFVVIVAIRIVLAL